MSDVIILGPDDEGIGEQLQQTAVSVAQLDDTPIGEDLIGAGIAEARVLVVTDIRHASSIPVACEHNNQLQVIVYTEDSLPPFASAQTDFALDPHLISVTDVVDAIVDRLTETN